MDFSIWIIEEQSLMRQVLAHYLSHQGWQVRTFDDGMEALSELDQGYPCDILAIDLHSAQVRGCSLLAFLKGSMKFMHLPVILICEAEDCAPCTEWAEAGPDDYLLKPFNPQQLNQKVRRLLQFRALAPN